MKSISLYFKEGTSDKEYHTQLEQVTGGYVVNYQFGKRGSALKAGTKTKTPLTEAEADKVYTKLVKEKLSDGYTEGDKKNDFTGVAVSSAPKEIIILPQLLNPIEDVDTYINYDSYLAQPKMDGERRLVIRNGYVKQIVTGINKKGTEVPLPKGISDTIKDDCTLDGEIIGTTLHIFDLLSLHGTDLKPRSCEERIKLLEVLDLRGLDIQIVPTAYTKEQKRAMYNTLKAENAEGIVFKKKSAAYKHGRPASGGDQLKFKFYATATFIVEGSTKGKRSVGVNLLDGKKLVSMGKVTVPPNHDIPNEGDLVEIRYLYAYKDGAIFQPVYLGKRSDCDTSDAVISQLKYKA